MPHTSHDAIRFLPSRTKWTALAASALDVRSTPVLIEPSTFVLWWTPS